MVRYSAQVKKSPYPFPTLLPSSRRPFSRLTPRAATARSGSPTPVIRNPAAAFHMSAPASCPMDAGNMRFPAPKNMPKSMLATVIISLKFSFFILISRLIFIYGLHFP